MMSTRDFEFKQIAFVFTDVRMKFLFTCSPITGPL